VKVALDTSVLVAALVRGHSHNASAAPWLAAIDTGRVHGIIDVHTVHELYSVLTKIKLRPQISPADAQAMAARVMGRFETVPLTEEGTRRALGRCSQRGLSSGAIFDAAHVIAAELAGAERILTFNGGDFVRLADTDTPPIVDPQSADGATLLASLS
jgi:predicted nucleic acid-binding protein